MTTLGVAFAVAWCSLAFYVARLGFQQQRIAQRLRAAEGAGNDQESRQRQAA